jgi:hypothetical protein
MSRLLADSLPAQISFPTSLQQFSPLSCDTLPTLPRELIEQILDDPILDVEDRGQFCLLNKDYLEYGRKLLYRQIRINFVEVDPSGSSASDEEAEDFEWYPSVITSQLLRTLRSSPTFADRVRSITFELDELDDAANGLPPHCQDEDQGVEFLTHEVLDLCQKITSLTAPPDHDDWFDAVILWALSMPRPPIAVLDLPELSAGAWDALAVFPEVKHLSFSVFFPDREQEGESFPDILTNLNLCSLDLGSWYPSRPNTFAFLTRSSLSTLHTLSLPWDLNEFSFDLSTFISLSSLALNDLDKVAATDLIRSFSTFPPSLSNLALRGSYGTRAIVGLVDLARSVPSSIRHLELPSTLKRSKWPPSSRSFRPRAGSSSSAPDPASETNTTASVCPPRRT